MNGPPLEPGAGPLPALRPARLAAYALVAASSASAGCFPSGVRGLWPPPDGEARHRIDVVYRDWHTLIVEPPRETAPSAGGVGPSREWEFAEKAWYLEGRQGITGVCRALCWPTAAAVRREEARPSTTRPAPDEAVRRWTFVVSRRGLERMVEWLEGLRGEPLPGRPGWYEGTRSYHIFFVCHHMTLRALRRAGLPVAPWWGYTAWMTEIQLDRAERLHRRAGLVPPPPAP